MEKIEETNPSARIWLSKVGEQSLWSTHAFDTAISSDENNTNFVESFKATLGVDKCKLVMTLLEGSVMFLMW